MNQQAPPGPPSTFGDPGRDPIDDMIECQGHLRTLNVWAVLGAKEHWPLTTAEAVDVLNRGMGYSTDAEKIDDLIGRGILQRSQAEDEWNAADVMIAAGLFELRREWEPSPGRRDACKTEHEIALERLRAQDLVAVANRTGAMRYDLRQLLELIVRSGSEDVRRLNALSLAVVLEAEHGVRV